MSLLFKYICALAKATDWTTRKAGDLLVCTGTIICLQNGAHTGHLFCPIMSAGRKDNSTPQSRLPLLGIMLPLTRSWSPT